MIAEEIQRRLAALKTCAQDFAQMANMIDGNFDTKLLEIKNLEQKRDKLREEIDESTRKAQSILQEASEETSNIRKQANSLLNDAKMAQSQAKDDQTEAIKLKQEAQAMMSNALQRQKEADVQYKLYSDKLDSLKKAVGA